MDKTRIYWISKGIRGRRYRAFGLYGEQIMNFAQSAILAVLAVWPMAGCEAKNPNNTPNSGGKTMAFELTCSTFKNGDFIPAKYTGDGADVSPPLKWTSPPPETKSFALICDDPDAPMGTWVHWVIYNIPPTLREFSEAMPKDATLPNGIRQGHTDFGSTGYGGPAPPRGKAHRYYFKLYALSSEIDLKPGATKAELLKAMQGKILAEATLMGKYQRK
jgi:Raf kinase inhibitor-like YbhB/YbcL family protein